VKGLTSNVLLNYIRSKACCVGVFCTRETQCCHNNAHYTEMKDSHLCWRNEAEQKHEQLEFNPEDGGRTVFRNAGNHPPIQNNSMEQSFEKVKVTLLFKKYPSFYEARASLPCSQEPATTTLRGLTNHKTRNSVFTSVRTWNLASGSGVVHDHYT